MANMCATTGWSIAEPGPYSYNVSIILIKSILFHLTIRDRVVGGRVQHAVSGKPG